MMLFLGEISYSIYIWGFFERPGLATCLLQRMIVLYVDSGVKVIVICALTIVMAYGSFNLIDLPARQWIRIWGLYDKTVAIK